MLEKLALTIDDSLRDTVDGFETLLDVLDQPARFLQLAGQVAVAAPLLRQDFGIEAIDAQPRVGVGVDVGRPFALEFLDDDVGRDIARLLPCYDIWTS